MKAQLLTLCAALGIFSGTANAELPELPEPFGRIGELDYSYIQGLYTLVDADGGSSSGLSFTYRKDRGNNFFWGGDLNYFAAGPVDTLTLFGEYGTYFPINEDLHIVGSGGLGLINISGIADDTFLYLTGNAYARYLAFGFLELYGGLTLTGFDGNTNIGPTYGFRANISQTWQVVLKIEIVDDPDRYSVGLRYSF